MNRVCQLAVSLAFIFAVSVAWSAEEKDGTKQSEPKATSVEMKSISYDPKSVEVPVGGSIVWTNKAFTNHTATSEDDGKTFDTGEIKPGETSSPVTFDKGRRVQLPLQDSRQDNERDGGCEAAMN